MSRLDLPVGEPAPMRSDARRNRERLLAAAMSAFTEQGADDTSLEEIARRAGVGIGTLYRHFPTRQSLLESVYRDQVEALCERAVSVQEEAPAAALISWLRALVAFSVTKRNLVSGLLAGAEKSGAQKTGTAETGAEKNGAAGNGGAAKSPAGKDSPLFSACRDQILEAAGGLLARAQEAGQIRPDVTVDDLLRLSHGVVAATERVPDQAGEAGRLLDIVLGGIWEHQPQA
jgi:AcrR family transcriptional regulator